MSDLKSTFIEELILISVSHQPRYGLEIIDLVSVASQGQIQLNLGTLYPALERLKKKKLMRLMKLIDQEQSCRGIKTRNRNSRKYYQITEKGRRLLSDKEAVRQALTLSR